MIVTISNGAVLDTTSMTLVENQTVVMEGDRVVDLVDGPATVTADLDVDAAGQYVLPGFIDAHVHLSLIHI